MHHVRASLDSNMFVHIHLGTLKMSRKQPSHRGALSWSELYTVQISCTQVSLAFKGYERNALLGEKQEHLSFPSERIEPESTETQATALAYVDINLGLNENMAPVFCLPILKRRRRLALHTESTILRRNACWVPSFSRCLIMRAHTVAEAYRMI